MLRQIGAEGRTTFSDANYTAVATDRFIVQIGTLTAPRTVTLPAANSVLAGQQLIITDSSGTCNATNTISCARAGSDTINLVTTSLVITSGRGGFTFTSDGVSNWHCFYGLDITGVLSANAVDATLLITSGQLSGGGSSAVPIGIWSATAVKAGTMDHAIGMLGLTQPVTGEIAGAYFGVEGRSDYGLTTGSGTGVLGLATFNTATAHSGVTIIGVRARSEVGPSGAAGTGLSLGLYATATGGSSNVHALLGDGSVSGDNGLVLLKGYITAKPGSTQVALNIDDVTDTFFVDCADTGLVGMTVKLKDTAGAAKFKVIDSAGTSMLEVDSAGVGKVLGRNIVNRVALPGFTDATANTRQAYRPMVAGADAQIGIRMPWAGRIVGISVVTATARTAGTSVWTVYKGGSSTAITATLDGTNTTTVSSTGSVTFAVGDVLDVRHTDTTYTPASTITEATVFVEYDS